jgi:hypothetical protein
MVIMAGLFSGFTSQAYGQGLNEDLCTHMLDSGISNHYDNLSNTDEYSYYHELFQKSHFEDYGSYIKSAQGFGLTIPVANALLGLNGDQSQNEANFKTSYDAFQNDTTRQSEFKALFIAHKQEVSAVLADAYNKCVKELKEAYLQSHGVFAQITPEENLGYFQAHIIARPFALKNLHIKNVSDPDVICTYGKQVVGAGTTFTQAEFNLDCKKPRNKQVLFALDTSELGTTPTYTIPSYDDKLRELQSSLLQAQATILTLQNQIKKLQDKGWDYEVFEHACTNLDEGLHLKKDQAFCALRTVSKAAQANVYVGDGEWRFNVAGDPNEKGCSATAICLVIPK